MQHHLLPPHLNGWLAFYIHKDKLKCSLVTRHFASTCWMLKQLSLRNGWLTRVSSHRHCSHNYDQDRIGVKICFLCVSKTNFYDVIYNSWNHTHLVLAAGCGCHDIVCFSVCFRPVLRVVVYSWPLTGLCGMTKTKRCVHVCVYVHVYICWVHMRVCICSHALKHMYIYVSMSAWLVFSQNTLINVYTRVHYLCIHVATNIYMNNHECIQSIRFLLTLRDVSWPWIYL